MRKSKFTESQIAEIQKEAEAGVAMAELAHKHGAWGCRKLHRQLRVEVHRINHKRTERLYAVHNLARPRRQRRRLSAKRGHVAISTEVMRCNVAIFQKTHFVSGPSDNTARDELGGGIKTSKGQVHLARHEKMNLTLRLPLLMKRQLNVPPQTEPLRTEPASRDNCHRDHGTGETVVRVLRRSWFCDGHFREERLLHAGRLHGFSLTHKTQKTKLHISFRLPSVGLLIFN